jgi:hypothetical protein
MSADFENATTKWFQEMAADAVAFIVAFAPRGARRVYSGAGTFFTRLRYGHFLGLNGEYHE